MLSPILLLILGGCAEPERAGTDARQDAGRVQEGTPEAMGILNFLNDASTTLTLLDDDVGLDKRAATSLIEHRNGSDDTFGTADDDLYDSIEEVDDQYYVGNSALDKLLSYVEANGWIPQGDDVAGSWEGVEFTTDQVVWTLDLANNAPHAQLDDDVPLDRRAADGIVAARPIDTMDDLAAATYVGASALTALRDYVQDRYGESTVPGAGVNEDCETTEDCAEGLFCLGEIAYNGGIMCVDTFGDFAYTSPTAIPDDGTVIDTQVDVQGLASVPVDVVLTVELDHPRPSDLVLSIENFNGYGESLWANDASPELEMVVRAFPSDDEVHGLYTVSISDTVPGESGTLTGWSLFIASTYD